MAKPPNIRWIGDTSGHLQLLDQRQLPSAAVVLDLTDSASVSDAIKTLSVRGAPAIGIAAAYGLVLAASKICGESSDIHSVISQLRIVADDLKSSRPTAVNLAWAIDRMLRTLETSAITYATEIPRLLLNEAKRIQTEDAAMCAAIARHGARFIKSGTGVLTHCNTGYLTTGGEGTAIAIMYEAHRLGTSFEVFAGETRPLLQGSRLTAWELSQAGIPVTVIVDSSAALVMVQGKIHVVIVGADRITANGDTANKIGTYSLAQLAAAHGIPFVVAAPSSTFDLSLDNGSKIPIEQRPAAEVTHGFGKQTGPDGINVYNPAFDVTPARLIHAIVTERGVINPINQDTIRAMISSAPGNSLI